MRRLVWLPILTVLFVLAASAPAQEVAERNAELEHLRLDHEALKAMSPAERRAAMRAYKQAREEEAARRGETPSGGGFRPLETPRRVGGGLRPRIAGTSIQYDSGTVTGTAGVASQMLGNRFDSALNAAGTMCCFPVESSGSITMITFDMVNTFFSSAVWSLYSDIMGTTAARITSMGRGVMTGLNTLSVNPTATMNAYMNGPFLAGIWQFTLMSTALGVDTMSTGGQGFHAISLNDGVMGSLLTTLTTGGMGLNAVFRVQGNVATPVELMDFTILE